jgi:hypothetical protein
MSLNRWCRSDHQLCPDGHARLPDDHERPVGTNPGTYNDEMEPAIRYVHTDDGVSLAYTVFGEGPLLLYAFAGPGSSDHGRRGQPMPPFSPVPLRTVCEQNGLY